MDEPKVRDATVGTSRALGRSESLPRLGFMLAVGLWFVFKAPVLWPTDGFLVIALSVTTGILILGLVAVTASNIRKRRSRTEGLAATLILVSLAMLGISIVWMNLGPLGYIYREALFAPATALYDLALNLIPVSALAAWLLGARSADPAVSDMA